jgi:hypothetical protein
MQLGYVQAFVADQHEDRGRAHRVDRYITAAAPGNGLPQGALPGLAGDALSQGERGSRQRGEVVRIDTAGVLGDDQPIPARNRRARYPGHLVP